MPISEEYRANLKRIGTRLIQIESRNPGSIRMRVNPNPSLVRAIAADLKHLGFKKPFLQSARQFIFDCVASHQRAMEMVLPYTMLAGPNHHGQIHCWNGWGAYVGWQGLFQLSDFSAGAENQLMLIMLVDSFFDQISDLLDAIGEKTK
jgi:hypothetical protein